MRRLYIEGTEIRKGDLFTSTRKIALADLYLVVSVKDGLIVQGLLSGKPFALADSEFETTPGGALRHNKLYLLMDKKEVKKFTTRLIDKLEEKYEGILEKIEQPLPSSKAVDAWVDPDVKKLKDKHKGR